MKMLPVFTPWGYALSTTCYKVVQQWAIVNTEKNKAPEMLRV